MGMNISQQRTKVGVTAKYAALPLTNIGGGCDEEGI